MRVLSAVLLLASSNAISVARAAPTVAAARAQGVLERVKARGVVRCGSVERPGLAHVDEKGRWRGLHVDVCRAVAAAVLGAPDRIEFHEYESQKDFDAVRSQQDDVYFLTGSEVNQQKLAGKVLPVATVFVESQVVMVPAASAAQDVRDVAGHTICFLIGSSAERSLENYFETLKQGWLRVPFSEDGEMNDAYNVQRCHAIAGEVTTLATLSFDPGVNRLSSRILPESLEAFPVMAATGTADARWTAIVAWTVHTLVSAERPKTKWYSGGTWAMPIEAPELGLDKDWQRRIVASVGHYGDIFERHLGKSSPLKLERGLNANQLRAGLLLSPFLD
jgi:general L-amino acid transport system substrate-binding protein